MINVTIVDNLHRNTYPVDPNTTLRSVLEAHDVDYTTGPDQAGWIPLWPRRPG